MGLWNVLFKNEGAKNEFEIRLHEKISKILPEDDENSQVEIACVAGLLARVAYTDMVVEPQEKKAMCEALAKYSKLDSKKIDLVTDLAIAEMKDLAGLQNHRYGIILSDLWGAEQKHRLLETLFAIAASDGSTTNEESEEIRNICHSLKLPPNNYLAARATVLDSLAALK
ncbi:MAG: TerB family tellurite resistance protein [Bacteriovoracaceae bacterium]|jgi:uncharacterized tellurite resistance protein B-like protein|nr:TerB family tellurite resistance protein [Bacteriovoracaceae bacterium]